MSPSGPKAATDKLKLGYGSLVAVSLVALALAAGIIGLSRAGASGGSTFVNLPTTTPPTKTTSGPTLTPTITTPSGDPKSLGSPNAPVTIEEYEDFQCSICQTYSMTTEEQLRTAYVDTGKVRIVYKHRIVYGEDSIMAAMAADAAGEQGKFWQYHDALMQLRLSHNQAGTITYDMLENVARQLGLKMDLFSASLRSGRFRQQVLQDDAEGASRDVTGTPTFFINQVNRATGAPPLDVFQKLIDQLLRGETPSAQ